jgi:hypothetical protein
VNQTRVTSNAPTSSNPSSRGRSIISRLKNIISKTNDAPSPSTPITTSTKIQLYKSSVASHANITHFAILASSQWCVSHFIIHGSRYFCRFHFHSNLWILLWCNQQSSNWQKNKVGSKRIWSTSFTKGLVRCRKKKTSGQILDACNWHWTIEC